MRLKKMKHVDFRIAYAQLGDHPGTIGPQAADALFRHAMTFEAGSMFLEMGSEAGRATVLLGIAARNVGAKVFALEDWVKAGPMARHRFDWAIRTHGLGEVVSAPTNGASPPPDQVDFLLVTRDWGNGFYVIEDMLGAVKPGGKVFFLLPLRSGMVLPDVHGRGFKEVESLPSVLVFEKESDDISKPKD